MQRAVRALVSIGGLAMNLHVFSEAITKVVHMFRFMFVNFVILDGVEQTLLRHQLSLIITRATTVTARARSHSFLFGIRVDGNECLLLGPYAIREDFPPPPFARFLGVRLVRHTRTSRERSTTILWTNASAA